MKGKILKTVTVVMLSAFLVVTMAVCPVKAASGTVEKECDHTNKTETCIGTYYPIADAYNHQIANVFKVTCDSCHSDLGQVTRKYSEPHSFGAGNKCTKCGYIPY